MSVVTLNILYLVTDCYLKNIAAPKNNPVAEKQEERNLPLQEDVFLFSHLSR